MKVFLELSKRQIKRIIYYFLVFVFIITQLANFTEIKDSIEDFANPPKAKAQTVTEYSTSAAPDEITVDTYDNTTGRSFKNTVWFTMNAANKIGKLDPSSNTITEYTITGVSNSGPQGIVVDPSHNVWFAEKAAHKIGKFDPATLEFTHFDLSSGAQPHGITIIEDFDSAYTLNDAVIFTELGNNKIGKLTNTSSVGNTPRSVADCDNSSVVCSIDEYDVTTSGSQPMGITQYNLQAYFAEYAGNKYASYNPSSNSIFETSMLGATYSPVNIAYNSVGPFTSSPSQDRICIGARCAYHAFNTYHFITLPNSDVEGLAIDSSTGRLWFTENSLDKVGYFDTSLVSWGTSQAFDSDDITEFDVPTASSTPYRIAVDSAGNAYFTEKTGNKIGKVSVGADFTISASPSSRTINQGDSTTFSITTTSENNDTESITLSASSLPSGVTASYSPSSITAGDSSTLTLTASSSATTGADTITITGTGTSNTHSTTVELTINAGADFTISASPSSRSIEQGESTTYTVTLTGSNDYSESVALSASGLPSGASASFSPSPVTPDGTSTLTITTTAAVTTGSHTITITGTGTSKTHSTTVTLSIGSSTEPDFTNVVTPESQTVIQGNSTSYEVTLTSYNDFASEVTLEVSGLPSGATAEFDDSTITPTATTNLTVTVSDSTSTGSYTLTVTGTGGDKTHSDTATLVVQGAADFSLQLSPSSKTVVQGSTTSYLVIVTSYNGFSSPVSLSIAGLPSGGSASYNDSTGYLSVSASLTTPTGTYPFVLTGTGGDKTHSTIGNLTVNALLPNFSVNPSSGWAGRSISIGASGFPSNTTLNLQWDGGQLASYTSGDDGTISSTFTVPSGASRTRHYLTLTTSDGNYAVSNVAFDVVGSWQEHAPGYWDPKISSNKKTGSRCEEENFLLMGSGFPANAPLILYRNDSYYLSITANSSGHIGQRITIAKSEDDKLKSYKFYVKTDDNWIQSNTVTYKQEGKPSSYGINLLSNSGTPGMKMLFTGATEGTNLTIEWDSVKGLSSLGLTSFGGFTGGYTTIGIDELQIDCDNKITKGIFTIPSSSNAPAGTHALTFSDGIHTWHKPFRVFYSAYGWNSITDAEQLAFLDMLAKYWYGRAFGELTDSQRAAIEALAHGFGDGIYDVNYAQQISNPNYGQMQNQTPSITFQGQSCSMAMNLDIPPFNIIKKAFAADCSSDVGKSVGFYGPNIKSVAGYTASGQKTDILFNRPGTIPPNIWNSPNDPFSHVKITLNDGTEYKLTRKEIEANPYWGDQSSQQQAGYSFSTKQPTIIYKVDPKKNETTYESYEKLQDDLVEYESKETYPTNASLDFEQGKKYYFVITNETGRKILGGVIEKYEDQNSVPWQLITITQKTASTQYGPITDPGEICKIINISCSLGGTGLGTASVSGYEDEYAGTVWTGGTTSMDDTIKKAHAKDDYIESKLIKSGDKHLTNYIQIDAYGPIMLMITEPTGRQIGWDPVTDSEVNIKVNDEKVGQAYSSKDDKYSHLFIPNLFSGDYVFRAYAYEGGDYLVDILVAQGDQVTNQSYQGSVENGQFLDGSVKIDFNSISNKAKKNILIFDAIVGVFLLSYLVWYLLKRRKKLKTA